MVKVSAKFHETLGLQRDALSAIQTSAGTESDFGISGRLSIFSYSSV
jgi:hypothetical protein